MDGIWVARVAVAAAKYQIDKPYDYRVPDTMRDAVVRGLRVAVPFGAGNRKSEGVILALSAESEARRLKFIDSLLEDTPALSEEQLQLAVWMS
ncbi:MAG: primosomal protein N', partial [Oscillospiraceae bacterium]|nr:primosomal protein N' [Oscillospiraceae bacterium]